MRTRRPTAPAVEVPPVRARRPTTNGPMNGFAHGNGFDATPPPPSYFDNLRSRMPTPPLRKMRMRDAAWEESPIDRRIKGNYYGHYPNMVFQLRLLGATARRVAEAFSTSEATIQNWRAAHPEFDDAFVRGGDLADSVVAESIFHRAVGYSHPEVKYFHTAQDGRIIVEQIETEKHYPPDTEAGKFWLTNRQRQNWRNATTQELTDQEGNRLVPPQLVIMPVSHTNGSGS